MLLGCQILQYCDIIVVFILHGVPFSFPGPQLLTRLPASNKNINELKVRARKNDTRESSFS